MLGKDGGKKQMFSAIDHFYQLGAFPWPIQSSDLKKKKNKKTLFLFYTKQMY